MGAALFVSVYMIASLVSAVTSGIFSALVGIPTYYVLRKIGLANGISLTLIGAVIAFAYQKYGNIQEFITGLSVAYGSASGFFFWLGSKHARDSLNFTTIRLAYKLRVNAALYERAAHSYVKDASYVRALIASRYY